MYYEEKVIGGVLHCRGTPNGAWYPVSSEELTRRLVDAEAAIKTCPVGPCQVLASLALRELV